MNQLMIGQLSNADEERKGENQDKEYAPEHCLIDLFSIDAQSNPSSGEEQERYLKVLLLCSLFPALRYVFYF